MAQSEKARFDARLTVEQKELFEKAALLGGFRNLTEFAVFTLQARAKEILADHENVIATERDKVLFFKALANPPQPNESLMDAKNAYFQLLGE